MPAKKQITKEKILNTAVKIVCQSGIDALNTRTLACACKCSTQPIYLSFKGINELLAEVAGEALKIFNRLYGLGRRIRKPACKQRLPRLYGGHKRRK